MWTCFGLFLTLYVFATIVTLVSIPHATQNLQDYPVLWGVVVLNVLAIANIPRAIFHDNAGYAFASSCATIAALVLLFGAALFPNLIVSTLDDSYSGTYCNAWSTFKTVGCMRTIALLGTNFVIVYYAIIY